MFIEHYGSRRENQVEPLEAHQIIETKKFLGNFTNLFKNIINALLNDPVPELKKDSSLNLSYENFRVVKTKDLNSISFTDLYSVVKNLYDTGLNFVEFYTTNFNFEEENDFMIIYDYNGIYFLFNFREMRRSHLSSQILNFEKNLKKALTNPKQMVEFYKNYFYSIKLEKKETLLDRIKQIVYIVDQIGLNEKSSKYLLEKFSRQKDLSYIHVIDKNLACLNFKTFWKTRNGFSHSFWFNINFNSDGSIRKNFLNKDFFAIMTRDPNYGNKSYYSPLSAPYVYDNDYFLNGSGKTYIFGENINLQLNSLNYLHILWNFFNCFSSKNVFKLSEENYIGFISVRKEFYYDNIFVFDMLNISNDPYEPYGLRISFDLQTDKMKLVKVYWNDFDKRNPYIISNLRGAAYIKLEKNYYSQPSHFIKKYLAWREKEGGKKVERIYFKGPCDLPYYKKNKKELAKIIIKTPPNKNHVEDFYD